MQIDDHNCSKYVSQRYVLNNVDPLASRTIRRCRADARGINTMMLKCPHFDSDASHCWLIAYEPARMTHIHDGIHEQHHASVLLAVLVVPFVTNTYEQMSVYLAISL